jgi:putative transposon-encoded protein
MKKINIENKKLKFEDDIELIIENQVKSIGTGGMVLVPKKYIGREVYILVKKI